MHIVSELVLLVNCIMLASGPNPPTCPVWLVVPGLAFTPADAASG